MSRIGQYVIDQEEAGNLVYDEQSKMYVTLCPDCGKAIEASQINVCGNATPEEKQHTAIEMLVYLHKRRNRCKPQGRTGGTVTPQKPTVATDGNRPALREAHARMTDQQLTQAYVENELLKFVDESEELTRSDLQGRAMMIAQAIIKFVKDENGGK